MEGIVLDAALFDSPVALLCGVAILAIAVAAILLGSVADAEAAGRRVFWAEWPLPEAEHEAPSPEAGRISRAA